MLTREHGIYNRMAAHISKTHNFTENANYILEDLVTLNHTHKKINHSVFQVK